MKRVYYNVMFVAVLLLAGACSKNVGTADSPDIPAADRKIDIMAKIAAPEQVKSPSLDESGNGNFSEGDVFSLMIAGKDKSTLTEYAVGKTELFWKDISVSQNGENVDFHACYPTQTVTEGTFVFDLSELEDNNAKDLLIAHTKGVENGSASPVNLTFYHAMHCLSVRVTADKEIDAADIRISCVSKSACKVNLTDGSLDILEGTHEFSATGKEMSFILIPQETSEIFLTVSADGSERRFALSEFGNAPGMLEAGKRLTMEIFLKNGNIELGKMDISGWEDQGTIEGEIIM